MGFMKIDSCRAENELSNYIKHASIQYIGISTKEVVLEHTIL